MSIFSEKFHFNEENNSNKNQEEFETETTEMPPEVEVITQTKIIPTEEGEIYVTTKTTRRKKVRVTKNITRRVFEIPVETHKSDSGEHQCLQLHRIPQRRGSFLYRPSKKVVDVTDQSPGYLSEIGFFKIL